MTVTVSFLRASACLSGFLFGYDTAIIATALGSIKVSFHLSSALLGLFVSVALFGAVVGSLLGGQAADVCGRENVILAADVGFILGALCMALAPYFWVLLLGRFLVGLAIGASANVVPVFLAELAELADSADQRGGFVGMNVVFITLGQLVAYIVGFMLWGSWRAVFFSAVLPAVFQVISFQHLRMLGRMESQPRIRHHPSFLDQIQAWRDKRVRLGIRLHVLQQSSGINLVLYWAPLIVAQAWSGGKDLETTRAVLLASMLPVAVNCFGSWLSLRLIDTSGRRQLLLTSMTASIVVMTLTGIAFAVEAGGPAIVSLLSIFVLAYSLGLGSVPWLCAEILPPELRASGNGLCTASNWFANMIFTQLFAMVPHPSIGFFGLAASSLLIGFPLFTEFPETARLRLDEASALLGDTNIDR